MKEKEFITSIQKILQSEYIGDDCAYLKDLGIVITQDSLVEDVHFKRNFTSVFDLGYKSVAVNISDISASGAKPAYLTISLSLPNDIDNNFINEFYEGAKSACTENVEIVGGDITGSDKIFISVCAIGKTQNRNISSRKNAQIGHKVIISGVHGSSAAGLKLLFEGKKEPRKLIKSHTKPIAQVDFARHISTNIKTKYAMTDTSDGLMDALCNISDQSNVLIEIDFNKIPYDNEIKIFENWQNLVLFGGEDYQILATVPQDFNFGTEIGKVKQGTGIDLIINNHTIHYTKQDIEKKIFNHF